MRTVVRRTAPRALPRSVMGTSAFAMAPSAVTPFSFAGATQQYRFAAGTFVKNSLAPIGLGPTRETKTPEELREELPSVFDKRPEEIDDYIRPERTYFERLEDLWDWFIGFLSPVEKQMQWMRSLHDGALGIDLSWGAIFMLWGAIMRLMSIGPMLYAQRNTLRMARCSNKTTDIQNNIKRVKNDKTLTTPEKRVMTDGYKRMEKAIYAKHKCHKYGSVAGGVTSPIMISAFMAIRRLAAYEDDLESSHFLWVTDLTMPDPTMLLPFICTGLFIFNFEMNQKLNRGGRSSMGMYFRWGLRGGAVFGAWYFSSQPACLFAYWIGMSSMGMLQPYLLRNQKFRDYFEFPPPAKVAMDHSAKSSAPTWAAFLPAFMRPALGVKPEDLTAQATLNKKTVENISEHDIILDDDDDIDPKKTAAAKAAPAATKRV